MKKNPDIRPQELLEVITHHGEISLRDLAHQFHASSPSLQRGVRSLLREGLVRHSAKGKKVELNPDYGCVVGIDLGGSHLHYALADFRGEILNATTEKIRPEDGPEKLMAQIKAGIRRQVAAMSGEEIPQKRKGISAGRSKRTYAVRGIAIGVPSPVDPVTGVVAFANNLPGWKNIHLAHALEKEFRLPVAIENDANMAALGEHWRGVARGVNSFVFIALGTGIGSGVFVDGRLVRGRTGSAGELFRLNVEWPRWQEDFGDTGYFEFYVSGMGIANEARKEMNRTRVLQTESLAAERDAYFVFEAFRQGDPQARAVLTKIFTMLGVGVADIVAVLDPDLIVLGGGVVKGAPEFILEVVNSVVQRIQKEIAPPIRVSSLEDKAQTFGAIFSALTLAQKAALQRLG